MIMTNRSKKTEERQKQLSVQEAFNLWDLLKAKYDALEQLGVYQQFAHDLDLQVALGRLIKTIDKNKEILESLMKQFAVRGPDQYRFPVDWAGNPEALRDEYMAINVLTQLQSRILTMLRAIRTSLVNEEIRGTILKMVKTEFGQVETMIDYVKLKGWIATPPLYPSSPSHLKEIIDVSGVGYLWDHLTFRYDNIWQTKAFRELVHDGDFRILLERGLAALAKQVEILETECKRFGITLPTRPSEVLSTPVSAEIVDDDKIYRNILAGLQGAMIMHAEAATHSLVNDRIRHLFQDLLLEELNMFDNFVKYGKVKSWLHPVPSYRAE